MYYSRKSQYAKLLSSLLCLSLLAILTSASVADENYGNLPSDSNMIAMLLLQSIELPFDPNAFNFLVYVPHGTEDSIVQAMTHILGTAFNPYTDVRTSNQGEHVTAEDLETYDILIVGWNNGGSTAGLDPNILAAGITGRVILTGHDLDWHTVGNPAPAAPVMLVQAIDYVLRGYGTGLITLGCTDEFPYLPQGWEVAADWLPGGREEVNEFTAEGLASGVYDDLEPSQMCGWGESYHDTFDIEEGSDFVAFERDINGNDVTIARPGPGCSITLTKTDDIDDGGCVEPFENSLIDYNIYYSFDGCPDTNILIIDTLPAEVNYIYSDHDGQYDPCTHTVNWVFDSVDGNSSETISLTVEVTQRAAPRSTITNFVKMYTDQFNRSAAADTDICCWSSTIIYVDDNAPNGGNGTTWATAFNDLQDALDGALYCDANVAVWVAAGTYKPTDDANETDATFELPDNIALIGHFEGTEDDPYDRNLADANNETIPQGQIAPGHNIDYIITADSITNAPLDGFTITGAHYHGIYLSGDCNLAVVNCKIKENSYYGIYVSGDSFLGVFNCTFLQNWQAGVASDEEDSELSAQIANCIFDGNDLSKYGLYLLSGSAVDIQGCIFRNHPGYGYAAISVASADLSITDCNFEDNYQAAGFYNVNLTMTHCLIKSNRLGVRCSSSTVLINRCVICESDFPGVYLSGSGSKSITNNWIYRNGLWEMPGDSSGIRLSYCSGNTLIRNNTICANRPYGIEMSEESSDPDIRNCIIWGNEVNDLYSQAGSFASVNSCLLQHLRPGNITGDPCFYNQDANDFHLTGDSLCIDAGTGTYPNETDFDGEDRTINGATDIGGDEYYWPKADYDKNWIVNFIDYRILANEWFDTNSVISLDADPNVDIADLALFCVDWLWEAPWGDNFSFFSMRGGFGGEMFMPESFFASDEGRATSNGLMIPDVTAGLEAMPHSLYAKVKRFYAVAPAQPVYPPRRIYLSPQQRAAIIADMLKWLDEIWLSGELQEAITYEQYLAFRTSLLFFTQ